MIRALGTHLAYPGTLALAVAATAALVPRVGPAWAAALAAGAMIAVVAGLERWIPHTPAWRPTRASLTADVAHAVVSAGAVAPVVRAGLTVLVAGWASTQVAASVGSLWPAAAPTAVQVALAVGVADLGAYVAHRWMHLSDVGWRIHAVHHASRGLNVMASARSHPFNAALTQLGETSLLVLLGVPPLVLAYWTVIKATNGMLQHANVAYAPGPWAWVMATPEVHRWHHSVHLDESNTNFGNTTVLWDRAFGTLFLPADRAPGVDVGIAGSAIPERYLDHLAVPFRYPRYVRADQP